MDLIHARAIHSYRRIESPPGPRPPQGHATPCLVRAFYGRMTYADMSTTWLTARHTLRVTAVSDGGRHSPRTSRHP